MPTIFLIQREEYFWLNIYFDDSSLLGTKITQKRSTWYRRDIEYNYVKVLNICVILGKKNIEGKYLIDTADNVSSVSFVPLIMMQKVSFSTYI
jgi:hypothetical protein